MWEYVLYSLLQPLQVVVIPSQSYHPESWWLTWPSEQLLSLPMIPNCNERHCKYWVTSCSCCHQKKRTVPSCREGWAEAWVNKSWFPRRKNSTVMGPRPSSDSSSDSSLSIACVVTYNLDMRITSWRHTWPSSNGKYTALPEMPVTKH